MSAVRIRMLRSLVPPDGEARNEGEIVDEQAELAERWIAAGIAEAAAGAEKTRTGAGVELVRVHELPEVA